MPGKRPVPPAVEWTKPPVHATVEQCDEALKNPGLTRTEQNYWLDARNEATKTAEFHEILEQEKAEAA